MRLKMYNKIASLLLLVFLIPLSCSSVQKSSNFRIKEVLGDDMALIVSFSKKAETILSEEYRQNMANQVYDMLKLENSKLSDKNKWKSVKVGRLFTGRIFDALMNGAAKYKYLLEVYIHFGQNIYGEPNYSISWDIVDLDELFKYFNFDGGPITRSEFSSLSYDEKVKWVTGKNSLEPFRSILETAVIHRFINAPEITNENKKILLYYDRCYKFFDPPLLNNYRARINTVIDELYTNLTGEKSYWDK